MSETFCVKHTGKMAVGYCSRCNKPYCDECLDMETGKPVCHDCLKMKSAPSMNPGLAGGAPTPAAPPGPMAGSPLNFKGRGLDDDPLGLFGGGGGPKIGAPKPNPLTTPAKPPVMPAPTPAMPPSLKPTVSMPSLDQLGKPSTPSEKIVAPTPKIPMDLDTLIREPQPLRPPFPQPSSSVPAPVAPPSALPFPVDVPAAEVSKQKKIFSLVKIWAKYLIRRAYEFFDPLAKKLKVPTFVVLVLLIALLVGGTIGIGAVLNQPSVPTVDTIQPLHFVEVSSSQVSEMDITAYTDLQNQIQTMGFQPVLQMTVPQLPSPNFFDVSMKEDAGTYSEIIKMPGQLAPRLSFVTVFTNGVWFSTNAWEGTNQSLNTLESEFYPGDTPDQLYVQHIQTLEKLKQDKEWEVQSLSENRYMAALSDRVRWFLDKKGVPAYQADFNLWH